MLRKNKIPLTFVEGLDTTTDEFLSTGALQLDNVVFNKLGKIEKRKGVDKLSRFTIENNRTSNLEVLGTFKNELCGLAKDGFYSYYDSIDRWRRVSDRTISAVNSTPVLRNTANQLNPVSYTTEGVTLIAWEDSRGGIRTTVLDEISGQPFINDRLVDIDGFNPKIRLFRKQLYLFWVSGDNKIKYIILRPSSPTILDIEVEFENVEVSVDNPYYDIAFRTETFFIVSHINTTNDLVLGFYNPNTGAEGQPNPDKLPAPIIVASGLDDITFLKLNTNFNFSPRLIYVTYCQANQIKVSGYSDKFVTVYSNDLSSEYLLTNNIISCGIHQSGNITTLYYHVTDPIPQDHRIDTLIFDNTTGVVIKTEEVLIRSVGLLSEPFIYDERPHLIVSYESDLQSTNFVYDAEKGFMVGKLSPLITAGHINTPDRLTLISLFNENDYLYVGRVRTRTVREEGVFFSTIGLYKYSIDLSIPRDNQIVEAGESLFITSSLPLMYDGRVVTEAGFNVSPERLHSVIESGLGVHKAGEYRYVVVYKWEDNQGQIHRSQPSLVETVTTVQDDRVYLVIPTLRLTNLDTVMIEIYRTEDNGSIFYLIDAIDNDLDYDYVSYYDIIEDDVIIEKEILYTTGGVLNNDSPQGSVICEIWQNRLITAGSENSDLIYYSKPIITGVGVEFSQLFVLNTGTKGGKITCLKVLGDHLIVFKENSIGIITGKGASITGIGSSYEYNIISDGIGCREGNSVVQFQNGILFKSSKGFYRMNIDTSLEFIGIGVKQYRDQFITSGVNIEGDDRVIFGTDNGLTLVFNSLFNIWTTFSSYTQVSAVNRLGKYYFVSPEGNVYRESDEYSDDGSPIISTIQTAWVAVGELSGFQRLYTVHFLGQRKGDHSVKAKIYYNYRDYENDSYIHEDYNDAFYGKEVYGELSPYGGDHNDYHFRLRPSKQKCTSFSILLSDYFKDNIPSNSFSLSSITLEIGVKKGFKKINKNQKAITNNEQ